MTFELKSTLHAGKRSRIDYLLLIIASQESPCSTAKVRDLAVEYGVRGVKAWNISGILGRSDLVIKVPNGWELTPAGNRQIGKIAPGATPRTAARENGTATSVFISHSGKNKKLAERLVSLIVAATGLQKSDIRCTSVAGCKLPAGIDAPEKLVSEINSSIVFIGLFTQDAAASAFVLFELGARWGMNKRIFPLIGPDSDYSVLPKPIADTHAVRTKDRADILQVIREVAEELGTVTNPADAYDTELRAFMRQK